MLMMTLTGKKHNFLKDQPAENIMKASAGGAAKCLDECDLGYENL